MTRPNLSPWAVAGLYVFAASLALMPLVDLFTTAFPPQLTDIAWRYGFMGLAAGYLQTPLLGLVLASGVAYLEGHAGALRLLGILSMAVAVVLLPILALWPMDVMQMRALREPDAQAGVAIGGAIQELKYVAAFLALALLGLGLMRTAGEVGKAQRRDAPGIISRG